MKIAFLSQYSPEDRKASSGTNYKIAEQLSKYGELKWIPIQKTSFGNFIFKIANKVANRFGRTFDFFSTNIGSRFGYEPIDKDAFCGCDVIAAFFCMPVLSHLKADKPIIYFSDATYPAMIDYYFHNRLTFNNRQGSKLERKAMDNADAIILSSQWAEASAVYDLKQQKEKVHVIEYGANVDEKDIIGVAVKEMTPNTLRLLFLGVDWIRKGGQIAIDAVKWLNENGINATLDIVGIRDLDIYKESFPFIKNHGFLNKNNERDYNKLVEILKNTDAMLLPTKAECAGIAFAEASANGLPVFTHQTGGVGNYVIDGINGYKLPLGSTGEDFGRCIKNALLNGEISSMSDTARQLYSEKLNWNCWGKKVSEVIKNIVSDKSL